MNRHNPPPEGSQKDPASHQRPIPDGIQWIPSDTSGGACKGLPRLISTVPFLLLGAGATKAKGSPNAAPTAPPPTPSPSAGCGG